MSLKGELRGGKLHLEESGVGGGEDGSCVASLLDRSTNKCQISLCGEKNLAALLGAGSTFDWVFEVERDRAAKIDLAKFAKIEGPVDHPAAKGRIDWPPAAFRSRPGEVLDGDHPQA